MDAGKLNQRITLQRRAVRQNASGQRVGEWVDVCSRWAQVKCTDSKTITAEGVIQHEGLYRFYIRHMDGITPDMRVFWKGRVFELTGPPADWDGTRVGLTLLTRELIGRE